MSEMECACWEHRIVIASALSEEMNLIEESFKYWIQLNDGWLVHNDYPAFAIRLECFREMGVSAAAANCTNLIRSYEPTVFLLTGIMGGFKDKKVKQGDIVVSQRIIGYELTKLDGDEKQYRWEVYRQPKSLWSLVKEETLTDIAGGYKVMVGDIISGNSVWASGTHEEVTTARGVWPKAKGVEMEGLGICHAIDTSESPNLPALLVVKGVSDHADVHKVDNDFRVLATNRSMVVVHQIIKLFYEKWAVYRGVPDMDRCLRNMHTKLTLAFTNGHFQAHCHPDTVQRWSTADAALGLLNSPISLKEKRKISEGVATLLLNGNTGTDEFGLEQVTKHPITVVMATIGTALLETSQFCPKILKEKALSKCQEILQKLADMRIDGTKWSFCELVESKPEDARVWDTSSALLFCSMMSMGKGPKYDHKKLAKEMIESGATWLHNVCTNLGWSNAPTGRGAPSLALSLFTAATLMACTKATKMGFLAPPSNLIDNLLKQLVNMPSLPLSEQLRSSDVKLIRKPEDADYARTFEKSTIIVPYALWMIGHLAEGTTKQLALHLAQASTLVHNDSIAKMSIYATGQLLQGCYLWEKV